MWVLCYLMYFLSRTHVWTLVFTLKYNHSIKRKSWKMPNFMKIWCYFHLIRVMVSYRGPWSISWGGLCPNYNIPRPQWIIVNNDHGKYRHCHGKFIRVMANWQRLKPWIASTLDNGCGKLYHSGCGLDLDNSSPN